MANFWPKRPAPEGFSIEKLAKSYRAKLSKASYENNESNSQEGINKKAVPDSVNIKQEEFTPRKKVLDVTKQHWANRDFYEYYDVA